MANILQGTIWVIDTPSGTPITTEKLAIKQIRWTGSGVAGDTAVVQDAAGNPIWESVKPTDLYQDQTALEQMTSGLKVPTLASGKLYIYFWIK